MRYLYASWIFVVLILAPAGSFAQISPGELSAAHADLEGVFNCTKCHVLGESVTNAKCLECHKAINSRIQQGKGYHASSQVRSKNCFDCHSEHHGRNFEMIRIDEKSFNHDWTGYKLSGAHRKTDCRDCHKPDHIQDPDYKSDKKTFLGLSQQCAACHTDVHQNTLSADCARCHNTTAFAPAANFNHSKTNFALFGKHAQVACVDCHQKETRAGKPFQRFAGVPFSNCTNCHSDPHNQNLGGDCKSCHTEQGWSVFTGNKHFDHSSTHFPLKGRHQQVDCRQCHDLTLGAGRVFQDRLGLATTACATCHDDVHSGKFGTNCAECHNESGFRGKSAWENFNHDRTEFPLEGMHQGIDCRQCHTGSSMTEALAHQNCTSCHADFHEGQFVQNGSSPDCSHCHTVDGFQGSTFSFEQHEKTGFPLTGAHMATPCFACHLNDDGKWQFVQLGTRCVECHNDVHQGRINEKYYPNQDCTRCHGPESWFVNHFDHEQTAFPLRGAHQPLSCSVCHIRNGDEDQFGTFSGLDSKCLNCHTNIHGDQFLDENKETDCLRCHGFDNWTAANFNHDNAKFKLEGRHAEIDCAACHKSVAQANGAQVVLYKIEQFECTDCHR
ncbi:MAG: cytochrome c3 family protein [Saprospiraceae bacterium]